MKDGLSGLDEIEHELRRLASPESEIRLTVEPPPRDRIRSAPSLRSGEIRVAVRTMAVGPVRYDFQLAGGGAISTTDLGDILSKLRELPDRCGYSAVWERLLYMPGGPDRDD